MTDQNREVKKQTILKRFALAGLLGIIILIAWLGVQVVTLAPSAFSSLASIADSVYQTRSNADFDLLTTTNSDVIKSEETVRVTWNEAPQNGNFSLLFACVDGVSIDHVKATGDEALICDTDYDLGDINSVQLRIASEKTRFTDVPFTISFLADGAVRPLANVTDMVTVVNAEINPITIAANDDSNDNDDTELPTDNSDVVIEVTTPETPVDPEPEPEIATETNETVIGTTPGEEVTYEYTYTIPTSNPDGYTDLEITYLGIGEIKDGKFVAVSKLEEGDDGAIQFSVKNVGTKTSKDWVYSVSLPDDLSHYSKDQDELKPNEEAVISVGFPVTTDKDSLVSGSIITSSDLDRTNNNFAWNVQID